MSFNPSYDFEQFMCFETSLNGFQKRAAKAGDSGGQSMSSIEASRDSRRLALN